MTLASQAASQAAPSVSFGRRLSRMWRKVFAPGDLIALLVTTLLLLMPALALSAAEWPILNDVIVPVLLLSIVFGFLLARSQYNEFVALVLSTLYCVAFVLLVAGLTRPMGALEGTADVINRTLLWFGAAATDGINQDNLVFTLLMAVLFWYLGYNAIWHIFRVDRIWRVILPPALILLTLIGVYNGEARLDLYLIAFIFAALLLTARSHLDNREWNWYVNGIHAPRTLRAQFVMAGAGLALIALLTAWSVPAGDVQERLDRFQAFMRSDPLRQLSEFWNRLIEPIESEGPATTDYYGGDALNLGGAIRLGDQPVLMARVPDTNPRYYWRSRVFERYEGGGWTPSATLRVPDFNPPLQIKMNDETLGRERRFVDATITVATAGSRLFYAPPQPVSVTLPGRIDLRYTDEPQNQSMNVSVMRPTRVLGRGFAYTVTGALSTASADQLRAAGTTYPEWVRTPNTVIGPSVSSRVIQLAQQIVTEANATTPYDQAQAIETWLRQNIAYNERIPAPPPGSDPLEWFLFESRQGYCTYYATAMIVMTRSLGIPARMAAGFAEGEWDPDTGQYVVRERDAHTWVEVYFPGYGWVEFEPTSAQAPIDRDDQDPADNEPDPAPSLPSATPTLTPSPTATPTPIPSPTPVGTQDVQEQPPQRPTITPSPTPTPTATPVIVPTVQPPIQPPPTEGLLSFLLPALGLAFLGLLVVMLLVVVLLLLYWWWEWRGLGGLSPIARAYARLERYLVLIGIRPRDELTPEEKRKTIISRLPKASRPVTAITRTYIAERYGQPDDPSRAERAERAVNNAWPDARGNILGRWLRRRFFFWRRDV